MWIEVHEVDPNSRPNWNEVRPIRLSPLHIMVLAPMTKGNGEDDQRGAELTMADGATLYTTETPDEIMEKVYLGEFGDGPV